MEENYQRQPTSLHCGACDFTHDLSALDLPCMGLSWATSFRHRSRSRSMILSILLDLHQLHCGPHTASFMASSPSHSLCALWQQQQQQQQGVDFRVAGRVLEPVTLAAAISSERGNGKASVDLSKLKLNVSMDVLELILRLQSSVLGPLVQPSPDQCV